ncbi:MAG: nuclear transport factor 2 family protein [Acidimicrobiales bacterium]
MAEHPNVELTRRGYAAFSKGDFADLTDVFADDIVWHVPGPGPLAGTYRGRDAVFGMFARLAEETGGTFRLEVHDVVANDDHSVALVTGFASRGGKSFESREAHVFHVKGGKITEFWESTTEPEAAVEFWT